MAPVRKYLKLSKNTVVVVQIFLDEDLLRSLAQKVRNHNAGEDTDSIQELSPFSLPTKDTNQLLDILSPHLIRVFSAKENNSYSAHEFFNFKHANSTGKVLKRQAKESEDIMLYRLDENGWKATVKIQRPEYESQYITYSDEQILERKVDLQEQLEEPASPDREGDRQGEEEEDEEKPLVLKKQLTTKYQRLYITEDQKVVVYVQSRPSSKSKHDK